MKRRLLLGGGVLLLLLLLLGLASQLSWRERTLDLGFQGEAARNPLYLAERLLVALGREADGVRVVPEGARLAATDTLLMATPSYTLTRGQMDGLLDWVVRGGHLITRVHDEYDPLDTWGTDLLLDALEVSVTRSGDDDPGASARRSREATGLALRFDGGLRLHPMGDEPLFRIDAEHGAYVLQYGRGEGLVTLLTDLSVLHNDALVEADHAEFLWQLAGQAAGAGKIWLQYTRQVPSLLALLLRHAWMPLLGLALCLAAWLWARARRFGPLLEARVEARRSLLDHVRASGRFFWRHNLSPVLLAAVRRRGQRRLARRIPGWRGLNDAERARHAARLARLPPEAVQVALRADRTDDFFNTVKILSKLATL